VGYNKINLRFYKNKLKQHSLLIASAVVGTILVTAAIIDVIVDTVDRNPLLKLFFKCLVGFFISSIFYFIVYVIPERRKRENIQKQLNKSYMVLKERIIEQILEAIGNFTDKNALLGIFISKIFYCENGKTETIRNNKFLKAFCKCIVNNGSIYANNINLIFEMFDKELAISTLFLYAVNNERVYTKSLKASQIVAGYKSIKYETETDIENFAINLWKFFVEYNNLNRTDHIQDYINSLWEPLNIKRKRYFNRLAYSFWMTKLAKCSIIFFSKKKHETKRNRELQEIKTKSKVIENFSKALEKLDSFNPNVWIDSEIKCTYYFSDFCGNNILGNTPQEQKIENLNMRFLLLTRNKHHKKMKRLHGKLLKEAIDKTRKNEMNSFH
jgi:hypothetical protein